MKRVFLFAATAIAFSVLPSFKLPPATVVDTHFETPFGPAILINPCNGDALTVTGDEVYDTHAVLNGNRANLTAHADGDYTATDLAGNTYIGNAKYSIHQNVPAVNGAFSYNAVQQVHFIGQGSAPNFKVTFTAHVTVNADGTTTVIRSDVSTHCSN